MYTRMKSPTVFAEASRECSAKSDTVFFVSHQGHIAAHANFCSACGHLCKESDFLLNSRLFFASAFKLFSILRWTKLLFEIYVEVFPFNLPENIVVTYLGNQMLLLFLRHSFFSFECHNMPYTYAINLQTRSPTKYSSTLTWRVE